MQGRHTLEQIQKFAAGGRLEREMMLHQGMWVDSYLIRHGEWEEGYPVDVRPLSSREAASGTKRRGNCEAPQIPRPGEARLLVGRSP